MESFTVRLIAEAVEDVGEFNSVYSIGLSESLEPDDDSFSLILSVTEPDDGDGYSVVVEPGQRTAYGAVTSCALNTRGLLVCFSDDAATELAVEGALHLELAVTDAELQLLQAGLRRVGVPFVSSSGP